MRRLSILSVLCVALIAVTAAAEFRAGIAVRVVTPDPLLPVSGGAGPSRPATKQLGDLTVRALVLEQGDVRVAICSGDFLGFPGVLCEKVRAQVDGVPPENILIGVTHTHSAPDCYGFLNEDGTTSADLGYLDDVCAKFAEAINKAVEGLQPASLKIATGEARSRIAYNYYAPQLYDPRCHVLQCLDESGKPFATLINYATHPEILGPKQGILSPDLCGPLYDRIAEMTGGVAIFMNSAQGGMVTADCRGPEGKDIQTWEECIRIGRLLADEALRIVEPAPIQRNPGLFCAATTIRFPVDSPMMRAIIASSPLGYELEEDQHIPTQVNVVNVGNAQILTIPGEALPNIGYYLKRKMRAEHNLLFGLTNDAFGYILVKEDWDSFERYEYITETSLGELTGDIFIEESLAFVGRCPQPEPLISP